MGRSACVLVVDSDPARARDLVARLSNSGYDGLVDDSGAQARSMAASGRAHAILLAHRLGGRSAVDLARGLKRDEDARAVPVIVMGGAGGGGSDWADLADDFVHLPCNDAEISARLNTALRLKTMSDELRLRGRTMRRFGRPDDAALAPGPVPADPEILLVGASDDPDLGVARAALGEPARVTHLASPDELLERLLGAPVELVVLAAREPAEASLIACRDIRHDARLFHLPILLIAAPQAFADSARPYLAGASDRLASPLVAEEFRARVGTLVKQERYRRYLQAVYRSAAHPAITDGLSGLYSHGFLHDHLARRIDAAQGRGRPLSLAFLEIVELARINATHGFAAGDAVLRQLGAVVGRLVRGEDLPARHGGKDFCVVMPDTPPQTADVMLRRVTGVVRFTEFSVPELGVPLRVRLRGAHAGLMPGDSSASLIARARSAARAADVAA